MGTCSSREAYKRLKDSSPRDLFPASRAPEAAMAGLWLYFSCLDEAHTLAQAIETPDGSFWHGIMHRQEPDAGNAGYWFRRVGRHAIFPGLRDDGCWLWVMPADRPGILSPLSMHAKRRAGAPDRISELLMRRVQLAEWQRLFDYCATP